MGNQKKRQGKDSMCVDRKHLLNHTKVVDDPKTVSASKLGNYSYHIGEGFVVEGNGERISEWNQYQTMAFSSCA